MCNKVLWLDHGKQICFSNEVNLFVDSYEDFLINKELPNSYEEAVFLSERYNQRKEIENRQKKEKEISKLESYIQNNSESAIEAALNIIKKSKPELLK